MGFAKATGFFDTQSTNGLACWLGILSWYRYLIMVPFIKGILGFQTNAPNQQFTIGWNRKSLKKHWKNKHLVIKSTFLQISFKVCGCCLVSLILFMWFSRIGSNQLSPTNYWSIRTASFSAQMLHPRNLRQPKNGHISSRSDPPFFVRLPSFWGPLASRFEAVLLGEVHDDPVARFIVDWFWGTEGMIQQEVL